jgi:hypothetical protein
MITSGENIDSGRTNGIVSVSMALHLDTAQYDIARAWVTLENGMNMWSNKGKNFQYPHSLDELFHDDNIDDIVWGFYTYKSLR